MEECLICCENKKKFYISPCKHKWCMDCNLNPKFPRKCPYCRICVPLSPKSKKKMERNQRIKETKKILYFALANSSLGLSV